MPRRINRSRRRPRVFIGLTEVAGYYSNLERGLRDLGADAHFFDTSGNPSRFGRKGLVGVLKRPATQVNALRNADPRSLRGAIFRLAALGHRLVKIASRLALFPFALVRYDVFILYGLDSFIGYLDLPILKKLGKRVIYVFNGSDHRPPYINGKWVRQLGRHNSSWLADASRQFADRVATIERYADHIVALSASAQYHRRPFVHFLAVGIPFEDPSRSGAPEQIGFQESPGPVRILHCPTDLASKGTDRVRVAVENLQIAGHDIEYVEIIGRPNSEVLDALRKCDFVVDEVWSDTPMAGFATEAAFFGKPAVVSGYFAAQLHDDVLAEFIPPTLFCLPDDLQDGIERLVKDVAFRRALGARACAYVRERWTPASVAARFVRLIDGDVPAEWMYDPSRLRYAHGWGLPEEMVGDGIRAVVRVAGPEGLHVGHNAELEARLLELGR